jgi:hypothetical protein
VVELWLGGVVEGVAAFAAPIPRPERPRTITEVSRIFLLRLMLMFVSFVQWMSGELSKDAT